MAKQSPSVPYWKQRQALKLKAPHSTTDKAAAKRSKKKDLGAFYAAQTLQAPSKCENCKADLAATIRFHPRAHICHIIPKSKDAGGCPSVATHPMNKWFGCKNCHDPYDKAVMEGDVYILEQMPVYPLILERFQKFKDDIAPNERRRIPAFLFVKDCKPVKTNGKNKKN